MKKHILILLVSLVVFSCYENSINYDQIDSINYPNMLVTTGFYDSQVQYWEPLKWVAKLREYWSGSNDLLLKMNMDAGHSGKSGRFIRFKEYALEYAWMLDLVGIKK